MIGAAALDPSTLDPVRWTLLAVGAMLGAAGIYALWRARPARPEPGWRLRGVGELSTTTITVAALACLVVAYHAIVYALDAAHDFRAPRWLAVGGPLVAVLISLGLDALDNGPGADGLG